MFCGTKTVSHQALVARVGPTVARWPNSGSRLKFATGYQMTTKFQAYQYVLKD